MTQLIAVIGGQQYYGHNRQVVGVERELLILDESDPVLLLPPAEQSWTLPGEPWIFAPPKTLELRRGNLTVVVAYHPEKYAEVTVNGSKAATDQLVVFMNYGHLAVASYHWFSNLFRGNRSSRAETARGAIVTVTLPLGTPVVKLGTEGRVEIDGQILSEYAA
jgi:hypothetical protein